MFPIGGGNWNNTSNAGVFNRNWNNHRSNVNTNNSFRAAVPDSAFNLTSCIRKTGDKGSFLSGHLAEILTAARSSITRDRPRAPIHPWPNPRANPRLNPWRNPRPSSYLTPALRTPNPSPAPNPKGPTIPQRHGNLFAQLDEASLYRAYLRTRSGKRHLPSTQQFEQDLGANLHALHQALHADTYQIQPYRRFMVNEPKPREISAPAFVDRVVQHALYELIYPIFDRTFIHDSYGCRVGKGTHKAADQALRFLRASHPQRYTLQLDIQRFYYSIDRGHLRHLIAQKIKDPRLLSLLLRFAERPEPAGLPIGNLLSQLFALIYLSPTDHWIKRELKIRRYVRYVDDSILFNLSRQQAKDTLGLIRQHLRDTLGLNLSRHRIARVQNGINFVGFRAWPSHRLVRKRSLYHFSRALRAGHIDSLNALMAHAQHTATLGHYRRRIASERPALAPLLAHMA
ncbi:MAG: reverse transcriptase domain-containing protein [Lamprobacter sp.]|uniref:reverse transcriptase domain-containing protein n=1 Tax=Lamprobacter sp. TaxID=3100796 RepID=UPI002B257D40|nr:reverse transcriptase domain-containing protein [Lamprobacter sp.]MEA3641878.1 reverse transcriptase domain-containing protein [Lamprobacter sp.]